MSRVLPAAILFVSMLGGCAATSDAELTDNRGVDVPDAHRTCSVAADCAHVSLRCSSCGEPVSARHADDYREEVQRLCRGYVGPVVDCAPPREVICNAGRCAFGAEAERLR